MLKDTHLVEKRNILNEMRANSMTLQEIRFLSIYLSKINARNPESRKVVFPLDDFAQLMGFGKMNVAQIKKTFTNLLQKVVTIPEQRGGFCAFQLFKQCRLYLDGEAWFVEIDAHDNALPLFFEFKEKYFTYELWNALRLKSSNQIRMYEILKQYEKIGARTLTILDLKELLGMDKLDYPVWQNFKVRVLDSCQTALAENTDICFDYEPIKKGRKFTEVKFLIRKNKDYAEQISLNEFLGTIATVEQPPAMEPPTVSESEADRTSRQYKELMMEAVNNEFTAEEMDVILSIICSHPIPIVNDTMEFGRYHYLNRKFAEMNNRHSVNPIKNRFAYFKKMIETYE